MEIVWELPSHEHLVMEPPIKCHIYGAISTKKIKPILWQNDLHISEHDWEARGQANREGELHFHGSMQGDQTAWAHWTEEIWWRRYSSKPTYLYYKHIFGQKGCGGGVGMLLWWYEFDSC